MNAARDMPGGTPAAPDGPAIRARGVLLGRGRSGSVYRVRTEHGLAAIKVFGGDRLADLVHYALSGAPNPYAWSEDAVRGARARRRLLVLLSRVWFGESLTVADAWGAHWDERARAWALETEFALGGEVPLLHPFRPEDDTFARVRREVLAPFQEKLRAAGLDGALWQAGYGNPVALNNYLLRPDGGFVLIDAESGVPAWFSPSPRALFGFYLPRSWHHRAPLFDHVDLPRLRAYLKGDRDGLEAALSPEEGRELADLVDEIGRRQEALARLSRTERAISAELAKGRLTPERADYYRRRPGRWQARETKRAATKAWLVLLRVPHACRRLWRRVHWRARLRRMWSFVSSQAYREDAARRWARERIAAWERRGQLTRVEAQDLRGELGARGAAVEASSYLPDFGVHLGLKATFQAVELTLLAVLTATGVLPVVWLAVILALDGALYRSGYTLWRISWATLRRRPRPWVALAVGVLPLVGVLAFPAQMVWSTRRGGAGGRVARFLVIHTVTSLGTRLPIWGGENTSTEHWMNRLGAGVVSRVAGGADARGAAELRAVNGREQAVSSGKFRSRRGGEVAEGGLGDA